MVSVIVPAYNAERTLARTLDSLAIQTCDDYEVVIVNDGSQDGTEHVAQGYAQEDPRFRYFAQAENGGTGSAVNRGVREAVYDFLVVVAADDEVTPNFIEALISDAVNYPEFDMWARNLLYVFPEGRSHPAFLWESPTSLELIDLLTGAVIPGGGTLYTRELFDSIGGRSDQRLADDVEFFTRALMAGFKHRWAPGLHYLYWQEPDRKGADWVKEVGTRIVSVQGFVDSGVLTDEESRAALLWVEQARLRIAALQQRRDRERREALRNRIRLLFRPMLPLYRWIRSLGNMRRPREHSQ